MSGGPQGALDRNHPGYLRYCIRPDCTATYDVLDMLEGRATATGWLLFRRVLSGALCSDHTWPVRPGGGHMPEWLHTSPEGRVSAIMCECGWSWRPPTWPAVMADYQEQYVAHLISLDKED